jgi:hypothetical protein
VKDYRYTIEGEKLTLDEIRARLPHIRPATVRTRISAGLRTWGALAMSPAEGARVARKRLANRVYSRKLAR